MIKYIEPSVLVEDKRLSLNAKGLYVTLLHCSKDGMHCYDISKRKLMDLTGVTDKSLNKYLDELYDLNYIDMEVGYNKGIRILLLADNGNYVDLGYIDECNDDEDTNLDDPLFYIDMCFENVFSAYFSRDIPEKLSNEIRSSGLNLNLLRYAIIKSYRNYETFINYDYLINYCIKTVKDWESKGLKNSSDVDGYIRSHFNGYLFTSKDDDFDYKKSYGDWNHL